MWLSVGSPEGIYMNYYTSDPDNPGKVLDVFNVSPVRSCVAIVRPEPGLDRVSCLLRFPIVNKVSERFHLQYRLSSK